jgi:hypothetical protein
MHSRAVVIGGLLPKEQTQADLQLLRMPLGTPMRTFVLAGRRVGGSSE